VAGAVAGGVLSFQVSGRFNRVAFEAVRNWSWALPSPMRRPRVPRRAV